MSSNAMHTIEQIESSLWEAADQLRANSKLTSSEYCMPVLGVIFLRHASNRYEAALAQIKAEQQSGKMPNRPLVKGDFIKRRALMMPETARYDYLLKLPTGTSLGTALVEAMHAIEADFEPLNGQLPKSTIVSRMTSSNICCALSIAPPCVLPAATSLAASTNTS